MSRNVMEVQSSFTDPKAVPEQSQNDCDDPVLPKKRGLLKILKTTLLLLLKMPVFTICLLSFVSQMSYVFFVYYRYPSTVNFEKLELPSFPTPALTFCSKYLFHFDKFCKLYQHKCNSYNASESLCNGNPQLCFQDNKADSFVLKELPKCNSEDCTSFTFSASDVFPVNDDFKRFVGPFYLDDTRSDGTEVCFRSGNGLSEYGLHTSFQSEGKGGLWMNMAVSFYQSSNVYLESVPHGTLYVHSPLQPFSRFTKSLNVKPKREYNIQVSLEIERLLPLPFKTDCLDYITRWLENSRTAPISSKMCEFMCWTNKSSDEYEFIDIFLDDFDCLPPLESDANVTKETVCKCLSSCKDDCEQLHFDFSYYKTDLRLYGYEFLSQKLTGYVFFPFTKICGSGPVLLHWWYHRRLVGDIQFPHWHHLERLLCYCS